MTNILIDENGNEVWQSADERLEEIKKIITPELENIKKRYWANEKAFVPRKLNFNASLTQTLFIACNRLKKVRYIYAVAVTVEVLSEYINAYMELLMYVKGYYPDFIGSKILFTSFMGISASAYSAILTSAKDEDVANEISMLNDRLCELEIASAQSGISREKMTETKLRADTVGYNVDLRPDVRQVVVNNNLHLDADSVNRQIARIFGKTENQ